MGSWNSSKYTYNTYVTFSQLAEINTFTHFRVEV